MSKALSNKLSDTDPAGLYNMRLSRTGSNMAYSMYFDYGEIKLLLDYYDFTHPNKLVGKTFSAPKICEGAYSALNYLFIRIKNGGEYVPLAHLELYDRAAAAIAEMRHPDFSDVDDCTMYEAFNSAFYNKTWLKVFKEKVLRKSKNKVKIEKADKEDFSARYKGDALYLKLVSNDKTIKFIFGPYTQPFNFVE